MKVFIILANGTKNEVEDVNARVDHGALVLTSVKGREVAWFAPDAWLSAGLSD